MSKNDDRGMAMLIAGFGLGTLVGTVIGLLVAPKAGRELRSDIAEYSKDYYDKAKDYSRDAIEAGKHKASDIYESGKERAQAAYDSGKERAKEYSARVGEKIGQVKSQISDRMHSSGNSDGEDVSPA
ncbi:MAG: YtxH domain-containing protein [Planctomycetales bacterium]|nr:YtxH domain-containing protein [bacterium]UNM08965.1 MAG: YtxH domain-containing protein [Planctomycetales bacterium]